MTKRGFNRIEQIPRRQVLVGLSAALVVGASASSVQWVRQPKASRRCRVDPAPVEPIAAPCVSAQRPLVFDIPFLQAGPTNIWRAARDLPSTITAHPLRSASALISTLTSFGLDKPFRKFWQVSVLPRFGARWSIFVGKFGARYGAIAIAALYVISELLGAKRLAAASILSVQSVIVTNVFVEILKDVTRRVRPYQSPDNSLNFAWPPKLGTNASLASSHPASIAAAGSVLNGVLGGGTVGNLAVGVSSIAMGAARINDDKHWLSDTVVGTLAGLYVGNRTVRYNPFLGRL